MPNLPDVNKRIVSIRLPLEICRKVEVRYTHTNDKSEGLAYVRALEDATRDVNLTVDDYEIISQRVKANVLKRKGGVK